MKDSWRDSYHGQFLIILDLVKEKSLIKSHEADLNLKSNSDLD